jgi:hypothetical protein
MTGHPTVDDIPNCGSENAPVVRSYPATDGLWRLVADNIKERLAEGDGVWVTCTGCHESEDGYDNGHYPHSDVFGCKLGGGCSECGGIGAIWDTTDYGAMAEDIMATDARADAQAPMRADIAQMIDAGWKTGKSSSEVAEEILREFDASTVSSTNGNTP